MTRKLGLILLVGAVVVAAYAVAIADEKATEAKAKTVTLTGEVVDTGCYIGHGASGTKHKECAAKCIAGGMPMALLTAKSGDREAALYLLTPPHGNTDAYTKVKAWAGSQVEITGAVYERDGMKSIEVTGSKVLAAAEAAPAK